MVRSDHLRYFLFILLVSTGIFFVNTIHSEENDETTILFKLESSVEAPSRLYPGQRARAVYRIFYNQSIDITESHFPLLETTEFRRIGEKQILEAESGGISVQEISQEIEAYKPGTFQIDAAYVVGNAYKENIIGIKEVISKKIRALSNPLEIIVLPFPEEDQALSFSGLIGDFKVGLEMLTPIEMEVGDKIKLKLTLKSDSNMDDVQLPSFNCQPGFSGYFVIDSIESAGGGKGYRIFDITIRPKTSLVKSIPSFEISSFDPSTEKYSSISTKPIDINVREQKIKLPVVFEPKVLDDNTINYLDKKFKSIPASELEIAELKDLSLGDIGIPWYETNKVLFLISIGFILAIGLTIIKERGTL